MKTILMLRRCLILFCAVFAIAGCSDSEVDVINNSGTGGLTGNPNVGTLQVQFNRNNVLAQAQPAFAAADEYAVSILDASNQLVVPSTFQALDPNSVIQTIVVTGVPRGTFTVVLTSFLNGVPTSQVFVPSVVVSGQRVTSIGTGTPVTFVIYTGDFVPTKPGGTGSSGGNTGTSGGNTGTSGGAAGGSAAGGTSGGGVGGGTSGSGNGGTTGGGNGGTTGGGGTSGFFGGGTTGGGTSGFFGGGTTGGNFGTSGTGFGTTGGR